MEITLRTCFILSQHRSIKTSTFLLSGIWNTKTRISTNLKLSTKCERIQLSENRKMTQLLLAGSVDKLSQYWVHRRNNTRIVCEKKLDGNDTLIFY